MKTAQTSKALKKMSLMLMNRQKSQRPMPMRDDVDIDELMDENAADEQGS